MHPAPSVILFSTLSGLGLGLLAWLGAGVAAATGWAAFWWWGLGYALAVAGLLASTFHLGNPQRALLAFSQWRSSWLSREAWASVAALVVLAPVALSDIFALGLPRVVGLAGAVLALGTVFTTSMIYAQIRAVPRWHHWVTPLMFLGFALAGGALLAGQAWAALGLIGLAPLMLLVWHLGDGQFARAAQTLGTATGLGQIDEVQVFEQAHTAGNYLLREMIFVVGRKHAQKLRGIALVLAAGLPALIMAVAPGAPAAMALSAALHLVGAMTQRWLFFAEAEHVVGLYYGKR
jgi:DMSO reductase anchor subunit